MHIFTQFYCKNWKLSKRSIYGCRRLSFHLQRILFFQLIFTKSCNSILTLTKQNSLILLWWMEWEKNRKLVNNLTEIKPIKKSLTSKKLQLIFDLKLNLFLNISNRPYQKFNKSKGKLRRLMRIFETNKLNKSHKSKRNCWNNKNNISTRL